MNQPAPPPRDYLDWRTTDQDELERRRERARQERPEITNADPRYQIFSNFAVRSKSGLSYGVEIRDLAWRQFHCDCLDFRVNGLGTCKHVEAVLLHLEAAAPAEFQGAAASESPRLDLIADPAHQSLRFDGDLSRLPRALRRLLDDNGRLRADEMPELAADAWREAAKALPALRVSRDIDVLLEQRRRAAEALTLRRTYEQKVRSQEWPAHETRVPLYPYQREGMLHLVCGERALLADEMGLGKTAQAIAACALLHRIGRARRVLVVTPGALRGEWEDQIARFTTLASRLIDGSRPVRLKAYAEENPPFFSIATYDQMLADHLEVNTRLRPDVVIMDEAQRIKNWSTRTALAVKRLASRYAFVLTGTPIENKIDELYSLVSYLDPHVFGPMFRFNREFYELDSKGRPVAAKNLDRLRDRVRPILLRRRKADVAAQLPARTDRTFFIPLSEAQRGHYRGFETELARLVESSQKKLLTPTQRDRVMRLLAQMRMVCDAPYLLGGADPASPKIAEFTRLLAGLADEPGVKILVFSEWEKMLELARDACTRLRIGTAWHTGKVPAARRREEIRRFREDADCRVFLSTDTGGTGLNLEPASVVIHLDLPWNPARLEQRDARAWQPLKARPVTVLHLVAKDTIEQRMLTNHSQKQAIAEAVLDGGKVPPKVPVRPVASSVLSRLAAVLPKTPVVLPRPVDPAEILARRARAIPGVDLRSLEEREIGTAGGPHWFFAVVQGDAGSARAHLLRVWHETYGEEDPRIEVIDAATQEALERLASSGLVATRSHFVRRLWPPISPDSREGRAKKFFRDLKSKLGGEEAAA